MAGRVMLRWGMVTMALVVLTGCASAPAELSPEARANIQGAKRLTVVTYAPSPLGGESPIVQADLSAVREGTSNKVGIKALELVFNVTADPYYGFSEIYARHGIEEPPLQVAKLLKGRLEAAGYRNVVQRPGSLSYRDNIGKQKVTNLAATGSGLYLAIGPGNTGIFVYSQLDDRYYMRYGVTAELIDAGAKQLLWRDVCNVMFDDKQKAPTLKQLRDNDSALLRAWMAEGARKCASQFEGRLK